MNGKWVESIQGTQYMHSEGKRTSSNRIGGVRSFRHLLAPPLWYFAAHRFGDTVIGNRELENISQLSHEPSTDLVHRSRVFVAVSRRHVFLRRLLNIVWSDEFMSVRPTRRLISMRAMVIVSTAVIWATIAQGVSLASQAPISNESPRNSDMDSSNNASHTAHTQKYALPPPFTAQEFWAKVTMLLKQTNGYVTHERFEEAFKVQMKRIVREEGQVYSLVAGADWYMGVDISETTANYKGLGSFIPAGITSLLTMSWSTNPFDDSLGGPDTRTCIRAGDAIKALVDSGWRLKGKATINHALPRSAMSDQFSMGKNALQLYHYNHPGPIEPDNDSCVDRVTVLGMP
jgi:hypothetical protein